MDDGDPQMPGAELEMAEVGADEVGDQQRAEQEAAGQRDAEAGRGVERVGAVPRAEVFLLHMPHTPVHLLERAEQDDDHGQREQPDRQPERREEVEPGGAGLGGGGVVHGSWEAARNLRKAAVCAFTASRSPENLKNQVEPSLGTISATMAFWPSVESKR